MIYKTLKKVSDVCQLFIPGNTHTVAGVTITNNGDGSLTIDGTGTGSGSYTNFTTLGKNNMPYKIGDKLFVSAYVISGTCSFLYGGFSQSGNPTITITNASEGTYYSGNISEKDRYESGDALGFFVGNNTFNNFRVKFNIINLTEMYGAGNEPTTVEQFRQDFPEEMYDYKPYCFVKSYKTLLKATDNNIITSYKKSLICTTKNLFDINSVSNINNWVTSVTAAHPYGYYTFYLKPNTTYTFSRKYASNNDSVYACFSKNYGVVVENGMFIHPTSSSLTKKQLSFITGDTGIIYLNVYGIRSVMNSFIELIEGAQLELGDTATEYHPYGYL